MKLLPKSITYKSETGNFKYPYTINFYYDDHNRLTGWEDRGGKYALTYTVTYKNGRVESLACRYDDDYADYYTIKYKYKGNKITGEYIYSDGVRDAETFYMNDRGYIIARMYVKPYEGKTEYSYSGRNMTRRGKIRMTYDNKAGIFRDVNTPQWFLYVYLDEWALTVGNNISQSEYTVSVDGEIQRDVINYEYSYNEYGYPASFNKIRIRDKGIDFYSYTITYYEK